MTGTHKASYARILDDCWRSLSDSLFLRRCRDGSITKCELDEFLIQQFHYSRHFTRFLCALLANLAHEPDRQLLTENLFEEMGLGEAGDVPHSLLYRQMLHALALEPKDSQPSAETSSLVSTMLRL